MSHPRLALSFVVLLAWILAGCATLPPNPTPQIDLGELTTEETEVDRDVVPLDNCNGTAELSYEISGSRELSFELNTGGQFEVSADGQIGLFGTDIGLGAAVAANVGVTYGTTQVVAKTIKVGAAPGTYVLHVVSHQVLWKAGSAAITMNGQAAEVPFRFPKDFSLVPISVEQLPCLETDDLSTSIVESAGPTEEPGPSVRAAPAVPLDVPLDPAGAATASPTNTPVGPASTPTPVPSDTPTVQPTDTPTVQPTAAPVVATNTPGTVILDRCPVQGVFADVWRSYKERLGCNVGDAISTDVTYQQYEKGLMAWIKETDKIYVLPGLGSWTQHDNAWSPTDPIFSCTQAETHGDPRMGFGKLWCDIPSIQSGLGSATTPELPSKFLPFQYFEGGMVFNIGDQYTVVLLNDGSWIAR